MPDLDSSAHTVTVRASEGAAPLVLNVHDIKSKFPAYTVTAAVQCGGNRRSEMNTVKPVKGACGCFHA